MLYVGRFYILYILAFVAAILAFIKGELPVGLVLLIYSLAGVWVYLKYGTVYHALNALRKGKINKAKRWISLTKSVKTLESEPKTYYYYINGVVAYHENQWAKAHKYLTIALQRGDLTATERQLALNIVESLEKIVM